jgi:transposase
MPRPNSSEIDIEVRRRRGLTLLDAGHSINEVGRMLDCAPSSVMRWRNLRDSQGQAGLKVKFSTGRPRRLTKIDTDKLVRLLLKGELTNGFDSDGWTMARMAEVIEKTFGVTYHHAHISRLMARLGWQHRDETGWNPVTK